MVLQVPLKGLFGLLVLNPGLLLLFLLCLDFISVERLFLFAQFGKSALMAEEMENQSPSSPVLYVG